MHRQFGSCCKAALVWLGLTQGAFAQGTQPQPYIVAQSDYGGENGNPGGVTYGYPFAQTFTPSQNGTLYSLSGGFYAPQTGLPSYYIFQFRDTTANGFPSSQVLATVDVSTSVLTTPANAWINLTADFSSFGLTLTAGHRYALSIDVPGPAGTTTYNDFFWGETGSAFAGGASYAFTPSGPVLWSSTENFLFTVQAVPEPHSIWLMAPLCACLALALKRRRVP